MDNLQSVSLNRTYERKVMFGLTKDYSESTLRFLFDMDLV